ncbi:MAG TPA: hypothetical protein VNA20_09750 [Frankiaceae bacterium]|nr:hypothetical protein [Frankiaceae bacterium]
MRHFLLVFDRREGRLLREDAFDDPNEALRERFRTERLNRANQDIEVVVLSADSPAALRHTHSRYFLTLSELADRVDAREA